MHWLLLHASDELYGADRVALELLKVLVDRRDSTDVSLPQDVTYPLHQFCQAADSVDPSTHVSHDDWPAVRREYLTRRPWSLVRRFLRTRRHAPGLSSPPDAVIANTSASLLALWAWPLRKDCLRILYLHETYTRKERALLAPLFARVDAVVAVSQAAASALPRRAQARTTVIYNGFADLEVVNSVATNDGPLTFLVASRWTHRKGYGVLLDAWSAADTSDKKLVILGGPPPSGHGFDVQGYVEERNLSNVEIIGEVSDISSHLASSDVALVPSQGSESLPTVAIEAFRSSVPVAATDIGGLREIVTPGTGWLLPIGDTEGWASLISSLTREACKERGDAARESYLSRFSPDRYQADVELFLDRLESRSLKTS